MVCSGGDHCPPDQVGGACPYGGAATGICEVQNGEAGSAGRCGTLEAEYLGASSCRKSTPESSSDGRAMDGIILLFRIAETNFFGELGPFTGPYAAALNDTARRT